MVQRRGPGRRYLGGMERRAAGARSFRSYKFGTTTTKLRVAEIVDGNKAFATSAGGAKWAILLVSTAGPGGARHHAGSVETQLLLVCDLSDPSVTSISLGGIQSE